MHDQHKFEKLDDRAWPGVHRWLKHISFNNWHNVPVQHIDDTHTCANTGLGVAIQKQCLYPTNAGNKIAVPTVSDIRHWLLAELVVADIHNVSAGLLEKISVIR